MEKKISKNKFLVTHSEKYLRLDKFLSRESSSLTRSQIQHLIKEKKVFVNNLPGKCSQHLNLQDEILIIFPEPEEKQILPEEIPLDILYEDKELLVINKPPGMVVHPAPGHISGTLVNALLFHSSELSLISGPTRPGIVHRLDRDTSGVLVAAKTDKAHLHLAKELKTQKLTRKYLALVRGRMELDAGTINVPLGRHPKERKKRAVRYLEGKEAQTHYQVLEKFAQFTFLELQLATGRTHQIRVHLAHLGYPVVGDETYGGVSRLPRELVSLVKRQCLHAHTLGFLHPGTGKYLEFTAPLPEDMEALLKKLRGAQSSP